MMSKEAMKLALEALEGLFGIPKQFTGEGAGGVAVWRLGGPDQPRRAITALREVLAEQPAQQEPVAWMHPDEYKTYFTTDPSEDLLSNGYWTPLYTSPPQRTWVGLTNKDVYEWEPKTDWYESVDFARAIEAKLKEKNHD